MWRVPSALAWLSFRWSVPLRPGYALCHNFTSIPPPHAEAVCLIGVRFHTNLDASQKAIRCLSYRKQLSQWAGTEGDPSLCVADKAAITRDGWRVGLCWTKRRERGVVGLWGFEVSKSTGSALRWEERRPTDRPTTLTIIITLFVIASLFQVDSRSQHSLFAVSHVSSHVSKKRLGGFALVRGCLLKLGWRRLLSLSLSDSCTKKFVWILAHLELIFQKAQLSVLPLRLPACPYVCHACYNWGVLK